MQSNDCPPFEPEVAPVYITMVHGTWAKKTPWVQKGSLLRNTLEERLGSVAFRSIKWSGGNSHKARLKGAENLQHCLEKSAPPQDAKHFIIAHSHGGNIAMCAHQDENSQKHITGVVCMATPFICVRERELSGKLRFPMFVGFVIALVLFVKPSQIPGGRFLMWTVLFSLAVSVLFFLVSFTFYRKTTTISRIDLLRRLRLAPFDPQKLLIVRPTGDEASGALVASQFLSWMLARVWNATDRAQASIGRWSQPLKALFGAAFVLWLVLLAAPTSEASRSTLFGFLHPASALFGMAGGLVILIVGVIGWVLAAALIVSQSPFGFDAIRHCLTLQTTAESSPPLDLELIARQSSESRQQAPPPVPSQVLHVSLPPLAPGEPPDKDHSRLYSNKYVAKQIADWIKARCNSPS